MEQWSNSTGRCVRVCVYSRVVSQSCTAVRGLGLLSVIYSGACAGGLLTIISRTSDEIAFVTGFERSPRNWVYISRLLVIDAALTLVHIGCRRNVSGTFDQICDRMTIVKVHVYIYVARLYFAS